jgi:hypothetical protein
MSKMRAACVLEPGSAFEIVELSIPEPGEGQVRLRVIASRICHSCALMKEGHWPGIQYPRVPGHEIAAVIDQVGRGVRDAEQLELGTLRPDRISRVSTSGGCFRVDHWFGKLGETPLRGGFQRPARRDCRRRRSSAPRKYSDLGCQSSLGFQPEIARRRSFPSKGPAVNSLI